MFSSSSSGLSRNPHGNGGPFQTFLEGWLVRQEHYLDELLSAQRSSEESKENDLEELIARVLSHYQQYYEEKSKAAQRNVFLLFSPPWFSTLERVYLWVAGFKPGMAFRVVNSAVNDMSEEQIQNMNKLIEETKVEEQILADELARIQESLAAPPVMEQARRMGRLVDGEIHDQRIMEPIRSAMETLVASADMLRIRTAAKVVETLTPIQSVKFLVAVTQLQLRVRNLGMQRDAE